MSFGLNLGMNLSVVRASVAVLALAALAASGAAAFAPIGRATAPPRRPAARAGPSAPGERVAADSLAALAVGRAPFRASRRLAAVAYDPSRALEAEGPPPPPPPPKPALALSGIVWGTEPAAVIEGFPGVAGSRVVRRGEVIGEFRVKRIERARVVIAGLDTTWHLTLRQPWR